MLFYKGFYIWNNGLSGWHVQQGYTLYSTCKTLQGAKASASYYAREV